MRRSEDGHDEKTMLTCSYPTNAGQVLLTSNDKQFLTRKSFETFSNCSTLKMNNLGIVAMQDGVFANMGKLNTLYIDGDKINITKGMFDGLKRLYYLSLR